METIERNLGEFFLFFRTNPEAAKHATIIAVSFLILGFDSGLLLASTFPIVENFKLNETVEDMIVITAPAAATVGGLLGILLDYKLGRVKSITLFDYVFIIAYVLHSSATGPWPIIISRGIIGIGTGVIITLTPLSIADLSPPSIRGMLVGSLGLLFNVGLLLAVVSNALLVFSWRLMPIPGVVLMLIQIVLLRAQPNIATEEPSNSFTRRIVETLHNKSMQQALVLGIALQVMKRLTGLDTILHNGPDLLKGGGDDNGNFAPIVSTLGIGAAIACFLLVDSAGRKNILSISLIGMTVSLGALFLEVLARQPNTVSDMPYFFVFFYSFGFSSVPITLNSELFFADFRVVGAGVATSASAILTVIAGSGFDFIDKYLGFRVYVVYALMCALCLVFVKEYLPETSNVGIEDIPGVLQGFTPRSVVQAEGEYDI